MNPPAINMLSFLEIDSILKGSSRLSYYVDPDARIEYVPVRSDYKEQVYIKTWEYDRALEEGLHLCLVLYPERRMMLIPKDLVELAGVVGITEYESKYHHPVRTYKLVGFYTDMEKYQKRIQRERDRAIRRNQLDLFPEGDKNG